MKESASNFVNGKKKLTYKISHRFLDLPAEAEVDEFYMSYTCSKEPDEILEIKIDAPSGQKTFELECVK